MRLLGAKTVADLGPRFVSCTLKRTQHKTAAMDQELTQARAPSRSTLGRSSTTFTTASRASTSRVCGQRRSSDRGTVTRRVWEEARGRRRDRGPRETIVCHYTYLPGRRPERWKMEASHISTRHHDILATEGVFETWGFSRHVKVPRGWIWRRVHLVVGQQGFSASQALDHHPVPSRRRGSSSQGRAKSAAAGIGICRHRTFVDLCWEGRASEERVQHGKTTALVSKGVKGGERRHQIRLQARKELPDARG
jgi:hypothetical protein